jgi:hypothetical protein
MKADKIAARVVKGLVTIRAEVAKLNAAHSDGQHFEASLALKTIDNEYFSMRQYLDQLVDQQNPDEGRPAR